jgi:hypothetical protein
MAFCPTTDDEHRFTCEGFGLHRRFPDAISGRLPMSQICYIFATMEELTTFLLNVSSEVVPGIITALIVHYLLKSFLI